MVKRFAVAVIVLLSLTACGSAPPSQQAIDQAMATISVGLDTAVPAESPTPVPSAAELAQLKTVANRLMLMRKAAEDLQSADTITGSDWRIKVNTRASFVTAAHDVIVKTGLPERYRSPRLTEVIDGCAAMAAALQNANVQRSQLLGNKDLERCVNGLKPLEFVYSEYVK